MAPLDFDPLQLTPIGMMLQSSLILCVHSSVPVRNIQEFVAWVRPQGGRVNDGSASAGGLGHTAMELLRLRAALADPATRERMTGRGDEPGGGTSQQLAQIMQRDSAIWSQVVRAANIRVE